MKKIFSLAALLLTFTLPLAAQNWSFGAHAGPYVFGDFYERTQRIGTGQGPLGEQTIVLSATAHAGAGIDIERRLADRWALRLEGTFTKAPLRIEVKGAAGDGTEIDAGELDVVTVTLPLVFRINPNGAFRFHLHGGPALALYRANAPEGTNNSAVFEDTREELGVAFGGGVAWWLSDRFAIEGNLTDIITSSPLDREDFSTITGVDIRRTHNVHTTAGVRWRF